MRRRLIPNSVSQSRLLNLITRHFGLSNEIQPVERETLIIFKETPSSNLKRLSHSYLKRDPSDSLYLIHRNSASAFRQIHYSESQKILAKFFFRRPHISSINRAPRIPLGRLRRQCNDLRYLKAKNLQYITRRRAFLSLSKFPNNPDQIYCMANKFAAINIETEDENLSGPEEKKIQRFYYVREEFDVSSCL